MLVSACLGACGASATTGQQASGLPLRATDRGAEPTPAPTDAASATPAAEATPPIASEPAPEWDPPFLFERVLDQPVRSLALGRPPYVAVLSTQPWVLDASGWKNLALPAGMQVDAPDGRVGIFVGRDDKPRIMGARRSGGAWEAVYYRWREGRWERDRREIGKLSGEPSAGLYGVLGDADPEVVCKDGDVCIIKRRTGWKTIPAPKGLHRVWVMDGTAWLLADTGMMRLEGSRWVAVAWEFDARGQESGFWADPTGGWWVTVSAQGAVYRAEQGRFTRMPSPVRDPAAVWGTTRADVWVAGSDGVGHFDGTAWARVKGLAGSFEHVQGRDNEVWVGGSAGLWRGVR